MNFTIHWLLKHTPFYPRVMETKKGMVVYCKFTSRMVRPSDMKPIGNITQYDFTAIFPEKTCFLPTSQSQQ